MENEISIVYNLPEHWDKKKKLSFEQLSSAIETLHDSAYSATVKAVNRFATARNYIIGFYIVEYEQNGKDRAKYGDKLIKKLAEKINKKGLNETLLKISRKFYLTYPQIMDYLLGKSATASHFSTPAEDIILKLSFSHIREIMSEEDSLARFFYETECIKCCWSVQELRRQIATNLFIRSGISKNPQKLLTQSKNDNLPVGILLCTKKGKKMVEYALAGMDNKLFVSTYMLTLPDTKTLEAFLRKEIGE